VITPPRLAPFEVHDSDERSVALAEVAALLFDCLGPLHELRDADHELLCRSAIGVEFIHAMGNYSTLEHELFGLALDELTALEAFIVEAAACLAADAVAVDPCSMWARLSDHDARRVLWFAAMLRLAEGLVGERRSRVGGVYATWTHETLYVEVDGSVLGGEDLARSRGAALEAVSGRRLLLTSSRERREALRVPAA